MKKLLEQTSLSENHWTTQDWFDWLAKEEKSTLNAFTSKPALLIGTYHQENETTRDYEGREILELLQNANDQAAEANIGGRVLIELSQDGLIVANTGALFSSAGMASLQTNNFSPKRTRKKNIIGNKGLGFRSILNWSRLPIILSGNLRIAYSLRYAYEKQEQLKTLNVELRELILAEPKRNTQPILPRLAFPFYTRDGNLSFQMENEKAASIYERCKQITLSGYDTVIGMPFDQLGAFEHAIDQIDELRPEILLFTGNLAEICFYLPDQDTRTWTLVNENGDAKVICDGKVLDSWKIYRKDGTFPSETEDNAESDREYEIIVAVPTQKTDVSQPLFSYFPTDTHIPLPVVCHATLELEQNRKHIRQGDKENEYVLNRLAELLTQVAENIAEKTANDPWAGCSLLMPTEGFPIELYRVSFREKLLEFAKSRNIIPTLTGNHVRANKAYIVNGADTTWLPAILFPNVVLVRNSGDVKFLESLGIFHLSPEKILEIFLENPQLDMEERVAFIAGLVEHRIPKDAFSSAFLLDAHRNPVKENTRVFISPSSKNLPGLPEWIDLNFLNEEMRAKLQARLETRDNRELQQTLADFGLTEYSLAGLISALIAEANRAKKAKRANPRQIEKDLICTIFNLYIIERQNGRPSEYPERSPLKLYNQKSELADATTLYLGKGFGAHGNIVQELYDSWAPGKLVKYEKLRDITDDKESLKEFLVWLGVAEWPRQIASNRTGNNYRSFVLNSIPYPARFREYTCFHASQVERPYIIDVKSIDGLDEILNNVHPTAIVAWFSCDMRIFEWKRTTNDNGKLQAKFKKDWYERFYQGEIPSYIAWKLETTPWLLLPNGETICPKDCVLGERQFESFFPRPVMPDDASLKKFGIHQADFVEGLKRAGVLTSLAYLERDKIYAWLLDLPSRSPDGKLARPLYQWLLESSDTALGETGKNYDEFRENGKMWGLHGDIEDYFPVTELLHADAEGFPQVLLSNLKIVNLPKRAGADKVRRIFGVEPLENAGITRKVNHPQRAQGYLDYQKTFQNAKPFLFQLRASQTSQKAYLQALKELVLILCVELEASITYQEKEYNYHAKPWDWIIDEKILYVRVDIPDTGDISLDMLADTIGEALASIFRLSDGGDFARMFRCQDRDRLMLLRKLRGDIAINDIETIKQDFGDFKIDETILPPLEITPPMSTHPSVGEQGGTSPVPQPGQQTGDGDTRPLNIDKIEIAIPVERETAPVIIRGATTGSRGTITYRRVTDGDFCEKKALEFEEADLPARFPLRVGHIVGRESPRCDILSFATEEARQAYVDGIDTCFDSVVRFIEVKGRNDKGAVIELAGNELSAAEEYGERYFLYRLYEESEGNFILTILQNPVGQKEALLPAYHVRLENAQATQQFILSGGLQKQTKQVDFE